MLGGIAKAGLSIYPFPVAKHDYWPKFVQVTQKAEAREKELTNRSNPCKAHSLVHCHTIATIRVPQPPVPFYYD